MTDPTTPESLGAQMGAPVPKAVLIAPMTAAAPKVILTAPEAVRLDDRVAHLEKVLVEMLIGHGEEREQAVLTFLAHLAGGKPAPQPTPNQDPPAPTPPPPNPVPAAPAEPSPPAMTVEAAAAAGLAPVTGDGPAGVVTADPSLVGQGPAEPAPTPAAAA